MQEFWIDILGFTLRQSLLSALLSVMIGGALARFLYSYQGVRLERSLKALGTLIFVMPVIIPSLAFLLLFDGIYGLGAIVSVHVFLNALYCMNQIHGSYGCFISIETERQSQLLDLRIWERLFYVEWPAISCALKNSFLVVFCLCLSSFSVVLLLGGGPAATTLSVALYHSLSVSFLMGEATFFLSVQVVVSVIFALLLHQRTNKSPGGVSIHKQQKAPWGAELFVLGILSLYAIPLFPFLKTLGVPVGNVKALLASSLLTVSLGLVIGVITVGISLMILISYLGRGKPISTSFSLEDQVFQKGQ